jgi:hypothetical protein
MLPAIGWLTVDAQRIAYRASTRPEPPLLDSKDKSYDGLKNLAAAENYLNYWQRLIVVLRDGTIATLPFRM